MEKQNSYVEDIINRYVYQVAKHLPNNTRKDIEQELKTLIYDMLEERSQGNPYAKHDIDSILLEMGSPIELADKYRDKSHYLISPAIYPAWMFILKIVLGSVLLGISITSVLGLLSTDGLVWYEYIGTWLINLINCLFMAFAWVTLIFAVIEWKGLNVKELIPEWDISSLPPVTSHEISIPIWGPIAEIILTVFFMLIILLSPQLLGAYSIGDGVTVIPIFNLLELKTVIPFILLSFGISIIKNIWELVDGKYSIKYVVLTLFVNVIQIIMAIIIFKGFNIWNQDFLEEVGSLFQLHASASVYEVWGTITNNFVIVLILIYILDTASTLYKCLKSEGKSIFSR